MRLIKDRPFLDFVLCVFLATVFFSIVMSVLTTRKATHAPIRPHVSGANPHGRG